MQANRHPNSTVRGRNWTQALGTPRATARGAALLSALIGTLVFSAAPALAAAPETPTTEAATAVTGTTAIFHGELNPNASGTAGYFFVYGANPNCEGPTTEQAAEVTGEGIKVSSPVSGLEGNTAYSYCIVATHFEEETGTTETAFGLPVPFTTEAIKPTTEGGEVSAVTPFSASVNTFVNPQNQTTSCVFEYGETSSFGSSVACEPSSLEGTETQFVAGAISELTPATLYHYRVVVTNATGATQGTEGEFTTLTLEAPIVDSETSLEVTSSGAKLEAQVNPNYQETTYAFEYATNEALTGATSVPGEGPLPAGFGDQPASVTISGLQPRTTYYYRVAATNGTGTTNGPLPVKSFTTLAVPVVTTSAAQEPTRTTAEISGTVNPGGIPTSYYVIYVSQEDYEKAIAHSEEPYASGRFTPEVSVGSDFATHAVGPVQLRELTPGVAYRFAVVATNSLGTTTGPELTFTTSAPTPPNAVTGDPTGVTQVSATLTGSVDTRGLQTILSFEFGRTPALGSPELASITSESGTTVQIAASFGTYLQPETTYYYRATASNSDGVSQGAIKSFTTPAFTGLPTVTPTPLLVLPPVPPVKPPVKPPTKAQRLAKALKACNKKPKSKRAACRKAARKKYSSKKKTKK